MPIVGKIEIVLTPEGKVEAKGQVPSREIGRLMVQKGWADLELLLYAQEQQAKVQAVPASLLERLQ